MTLTDTGLALLQALADKLIPGLSPSLQITLVSQVLDETAQAPIGAEGKSVKDINVLDFVVSGHVARKEALQEFNCMFHLAGLSIGLSLRILSAKLIPCFCLQLALTRALESPNPNESQRLINELLLQRSYKSLDEARRVASRRSGARGKAARQEELRAEAEVEAAEKR